MGLQEYQGKENNKSNKLTILLLIIYLIVLFWILLFKLGVHFSYMQKRNFAIIPFHDAKIDYSEIILNMVVFVPVGIYVGVLCRRWSLGKKLLSFFLLSLMIESFQFIFRVGAFDTTDIITNTIGGIIGLMIFLAIEKIINNTVKAQKFINIIAGIGTVLIVALLVLLKMNMLPIRYQ
jgi:glycopeptide antibiotics resistance protein